MNEKKELKSGKDIKAMEEKEELKSGKDIKAMEEKEKSERITNIAANAFVMSGLRNPDRKMQQAFYEKFMDVCKDYGYSFSFENNSLSHRIPDREFIGLAMLMGAK